jgi:hypothetical protein
MKKNIILLIMALLSFNLNAFEDLNNIKNLEVKNYTDFNDPKLKELVDKAKLAGYDFNKSFIRSEEISGDNVCIHCPKHILLTEQINKVIDKLALDPKAKMNEELPAKINRLKFLFYTEAIRSKNGGIDCQRHFDITPDLKPTKFDGQFKMLAEEVLPFRAITEIQYMDPSLQEMVYYYRGEGDDKNIIVQAILTKKGGKFRYFRYTPSKSESNPYNLPDIDGPSEAPAMEPVSPVYGATTDTPSETTPAKPARLSTTSVSYKTYIEKSEHQIPSNVHFIKADSTQELSQGGLQVKGTSDVTLKGNNAKLNLITNGNKNLASLDLNTHLDGTSEKVLVVPFSINIPAISKDISVTGAGQILNNAQILNMTITDKNAVVIRTEYYKNSDTNKDTILIARDVQIDNSQVISMVLRKDEADKAYAALTHVKTLKDNITLILNVSVNPDKAVSLTYQLNAKF